MVDPGVLVSALISPAGAPARLLREWVAGRFELVVSPKLLAELEQVLKRPKFRRYVSEARASAYVAAIRSDALDVDDPDAIEQRLTPDPKDDYLVVLARAAGAHVLVSGDPHLTGLESPERPVVTPQAFLDGLERAQPS